MSDICAQKEKVEDMSNGHGANLKEPLMGKAGTSEQQNNTLLDSNTEH